MANEVRVRAAIKSFLQKMKALDAAVPEELTEDALEMTEEVADALCEEAKDENTLEKEGKDEEPDIDKKVQDAVARALRDAGLVKDSAMKALDELEEKAEDADNEESVTVDPEKINDSAAEMLKYVRKMKPIVASIQDAKQRKIMSDSLAAMVKLSTNDQYADVLSAAAKNAAQANEKNKVFAADADYDYGKQIAQKFNPHYKKEDK